MQCKTTAVVGNLQYIEYRNGSQYKFTEHFKHTDVKNVLKIQLLDKVKNKQIDKTRQNYKIKIQTPTLIL